MKQTYRLTRRFRHWAAGQDVELTEEAAIQANNESPGVLELVEPPATAAAPERPKAQEPKPEPKP